MADPIAIYGAITGTIGTAASLYLLRRRIRQEQPKLIINITYIKRVLENDGYLVILLRVLITNGSRVDNSVCQIRLEAREDGNFTFPAIEPFLPNNADIAVAPYGDDASMEEICSQDQAIILPLNIAARTSKDGWLAFAIEPSQVEKAVKYHWYVRVIDQDGKSHTSPSTQDQSLNQK